MRGDTLHWPNNIPFWVEPARLINCCMPSHYVTSLDLLHELSLCIKHQEPDESCLVTPPHICFRTLPLIPGIRRATPLHHIMCSAPNFKPRKYPQHEQKKQKKTAAATTSLRLLYREYSRRQPPNSTHPLYSWGQQNPVSAYPCALCPTSYT